MVMGLIASIVLTGCTQRVTDFTIISTKNVDLSNVANMKRGSERVEGEDAVYMIIFIPTGTRPNLKEAIDDAVEKVPGAVALVDGVVSVENWYFFIGKTAWIVEGTPLIDPKLVSTLPSKYMISKYNEDKKDFEISYVSKSEFESFKVEHNAKKIEKSL